MVRKGLTMTRSRRDHGFTLLEIMVAAVIFAFVAAVAGQTMANAAYLTVAGQRSRELRMLAERKLGEVLTFEQHFDDVLGPEDFGSDYPEYGDRFKDWQWQLDVRDVVVYGIDGAENAQYLHGVPSDDEKAAALSPAAGTAGAQPGQPAKKGEKQLLRELILTVFTPADEGGSDSVQIITFMPLLNQKPAAGGAK